MGAERKIPLTLLGVRVARLPTELSLSGWVGVLIYLCIIRSIRRVLAAFLFLKRIRDERGNRVRCNSLLSYRRCSSQDSLGFAVVTY